mgnify:CR=1 FL=1
MIRIISGRYKGQKLQNIKSKHIRPTQARVKKSILEILEPFTKKDVLDLFSGSGALGIEALSRGANYAVAIDNNRKNFKNLVNNFKNICSPDNYKVECMDAIKYLKSTKEKFDIILCDPPYYKYDYMKIFNESKPIIKKGGVFCMEMEKNVVDENIFRVKIYGSIQVILWRNDE